MITLCDGSKVDADTYFAFKKNISRMVSEHLDADPLLSVFASFVHGRSANLDGDSYFRAHWEQYQLTDREGNIAPSTITLFRNFAYRNEDMFLGWSYRWPAEDETDA